MATPIDKTVLLVDDEQGFLASLVAGLSEGPGRRYLAAHDGRRAVELLEANHVDLVVTDLRMPATSGFDLLAWLGEHRPAIPTIVMTAFGTPDLEAELEALGVSAYVEKPIDIEQLERKIEAALAPPAGLREVRRFPPGADALLTAMRDAGERALDGEVIVRRGPDAGRVYLVAGAVAWAVSSTAPRNFTAFLGDRTALSADDLRGVFEECKRTGKNFGQTLVEWGLLDEPTVRQLLLEHVSEKVGTLLGWRDPEVMFVPERRRFRGVLLFGVDEVLDAARARHRESRLHAMAEQTLLPPMPESSAPAPSPNATPTTHSQPTQGEQPMQAQKIKEHLESLRGVDGFLAAAVFIPTGELVAAVSSSSELHLEQLGALANDVLLKSQKATDIMGVGRGNQIQVTAPRATIFVRCLNENTDFAANEPGRAHVHTMLILSPEGNVALGKMQLEKIVQTIAPFMR